MRYLFILLFCFIGFNSKAQSTYRPFPTGVTYWTLQYYSFPAGQYIENYRVFKMEGDTVLLETIPYKKIYRTSYPGYAYFGGLREENKVIYFCPKDSTKEFTLYNFNALGGEYVYNVFAYDIINSTSYITDSLLVYERDTISHTQSFENESIWEGFGSTSGPISATYYGNSTGSYNLVCVSVDNIPVYGNPSKCLTDIEETIDESLLDIYPNPASNYFTIQSPTNISAIDIFSVDGVLQQSAEVNTTEAIVPIDNLANGIYLVSLKTAKGNLTKLLVVQK
jgi:hypothetical protein